MPDTIYYTQDGKGVPFDSLPKEVQALIQQNQPVDDGLNAKQSPVGYITAFIIVLVISFIIVRLIKALTKNEHQDYVATATTATTRSRPNTQETKEYYIYEGGKLGLSHEEITNILVKHYPFYNRLWPTVQYRFQQRLFSFLHSKSFIIYSQDPFKEMPVLASAAAIHLTLGLDEYMLPWFKYICIHPEEYFANGTMHVLAGNVEGNIVTLAWNQLLKGIKDESDGVNVGLHEMAHALYYQQAVVENNKQQKFSSYFEKVMREGEEVYRLKDSQRILYTDYAYRNLQEFWAESVEIFFEKPADMLRCYPEIYQTIKALLKQDPLNKENPLC